MVLVHHRRRGKLLSFVRTDRRFIDDWWFIYHKTGKHSLFASFKLKELNNAVGR